MRWEVGFDLLIACGKIEVVLPSPVGVLASKNIYFCFFQVTKVPNVNYISSLGCK